MDVANGGALPGTNVWQCTPFGNDAQKWKIARAADGSVTLVSKLSGLALDIADELAVAGTNIQTYTVNGAPAQRFALTPVSDPAPEALLAAGVYEICAAGDTSYALDVANASLVSGADVRLWSRNHSQAQKWYIEPDSEGYYTITSMGSGLVLDVSNGGLTPGTNVWQCTPFGNSMQKWRLVDSGNGSFSLFSKGNVLALDIADGICAAGTDVRTWTPNGAIAQSFVFSPCESTYADGTYELALSNDKGIDLDVFDASTESGANVQVHTNNGGYAQKWHVTTRDDGYCTIESLCSGKVLAIEGGNAAVGANVCQQTADGTDSQLWKLVPLGNGAYRIASKSGRVRALPFGEERRARLECGRIVVHPEENPDHHRRLLHHRRIHQPVGEARCARCLPRKRRERAAAYRERFERAGGEDLDERRRILHDRVPLLAQGARCGQWWAHPWHKRVAVHAVRQRRAEMVPEVCGRPVV